MRDEWNTTELRLINGELRWVIIHHKLITIIEIKPSWWRRLCYYMAR